MTHYTDYFPGMTEADVFQSGRDGFTRGWKNIPPYLIAAERTRSENFIGYATIWMNGWKHQKSLSGCPMCEPGECPGGAHRNALAEGGIYTREQWLALHPQGVAIESHNEGMDGL